MIPLPWIDVVGFWIGIFLTLSILSYLYKDNPFYKLAEHLFVGVSIGYVIVQQYYNVLRPNLIDHLVRDPFGEGLPSWVALALVLALFVRAASRRLAWVGRYPVAFVVALYAGIQINAVGESDLAQQIAISTQSLDAPRVNLNAAPPAAMSTLPGFSPVVARKLADAREAGFHLGSLEDLERLPGLSEAQRQDLRDGRGRLAGLDAQAATVDGERYWFGIFSRLLLLVGLIASLVYFYFSIEQKGAVGKVARFGVYVLMIGFGASFGYTVQGRLALAVGRAMDLLDKDKTAELAAQIDGPLVSLICIVLITAGIVLWERWYLPRQKAAAPDEPPPDEDLPAF